MKLTQEERKAVFAGTLKVLRRPKKPEDQEAGHKIIVSQTRGGRHIVDRSTGETVDIPPEPRLWIALKGWHLRQGSTEWETAVMIHDLREASRELAGGIGGHAREAGLKTRWGQRVVHRDGKIEVETKRVPTKEEQRENWTPETERGYGGSSGRGLDQRDSDGRHAPATAVNDSTLSSFAAAVEDQNIGLREKQRKRERQMDEEIKMSREYRRGRRRRAKAASTRKLDVVVSHSDGSSEAAEVELEGAEIKSLMPRPEQTPAAA